MAPPKPIPVKSAKSRKQDDEYQKKRTAFLIVHSICQAKLVGCTGNATDVHHMAGRIGENHLNMSTWKAVCRSCHSWIEEHPLEAKELKLSENRLN